MFKVRVGNEFAEKLVFTFLCLCAVFDLKEKEIPLIFIIVGMAGGIGFNVWQFWYGTVSVKEVGSFFLPGIFFVLISWGTKEKVGYGDGLLLFITGLFAGFYKCFAGVCIGLVFSAASALLLLAVHKVKKDSRIPFVPFLAAGMGVSMFL